MARVEYAIAQVTMAQQLHKQKIWNTEKHYIND